MKAEAPAEDAARLSLVGDTYRALLRAHEEIRPICRRLQEADGGYRVRVIVTHLVERVLVEAKQLTVRWAQSRGDVGEIWAVIENESLSEGRRQQEWQLAKRSI